MLFGLVTIVAGVLAHWSGSGMTASPVVVVGGFVLSSAVGWLLLPRRRVRSVVLSSVGLQVVLHVGFAASMVAGGMNALSMILCQGGHDGGVSVNLPPGYLAPRHGALALMFGLQGVPMLLAHIAAGALSGCWLNAVDRLARGLGAVLHSMLRTALPTAVAAGTVTLGRPGRPARLRAHRAAAYFCDWVTGGCGRRGPPACALC